MLTEKDIIESVWPPLRTEIEDTTVRMKCFGRSYEMEGPLPRKITSGGRDVLAAPAVLKASFNGKEEPLINEHAYIEKETDDELVYLTQSTIGNVVLNSRVTAERDGLLWIDLMLFPYTTNGVMNVAPEDDAVKLDRLCLEIPVRQEIAELYHYWPVVSGGGLSNSGSIPEEGLFLPFRPHLWIGKEEAGLSFYAETNQQWQNDDPSRVISLEKTGNGSVMKIRLLDSTPAAWKGCTHDSWISALEPIRFSFGLQASPVKPYRKADGFTRVYHKGIACADPEHPLELEAFEKEAEELASLGVKWRSFHEDWSMIQNYGRPADETLFKAKVDALHKCGIRAMVYFGYEYASCAPHFYEEYRKAVVRNAKGFLVGGYQRRPPQRDYTVCYAGCYSETMLERCRRAMDEYGVDGIYTDGTYEPWGCANGEHGCGWTDEQGIRHETWPLRQVREHVKKLYLQTHVRGGIVEAHQSSCVFPMLLAYCDGYWDGEHVATTTDPVTRQLRFKTGKELIETYSAGSASGIGTMRAEFTGINIGVPCQFLSYSPTLEECCGLTIPYGVLPKALGSIQNVRQASRHWDMIDRFGLTMDRFFPFWKKDCPVRCSNERIICSAWDTPDGIMAVFVNLIGEPTETGFTCTMPYSEAVDLRTEETLRTERIEIKDISPVYVFLKK